MQHDGVRGDSVDMRASGSEVGHVSRRRPGWIHRPHSLQRRSVSTFCAFMVTVAMVVVPEQVCALTACQPPACLLLVHLIVVFM